MQTPYRRHNKWENLYISEGQPGTRGDYADARVLGT
jgi:hypothetical protein